MWPGKEKVIMDLTEYQERIEKAQKKLMTLPEGWLPEYKIRKKNEQIRQKMKAEISHVQGLQKIVYSYLDENPELKTDERVLKTFEGAGSMEGLPVEFKSKHF